MSFDPEWSLYCIHMINSTGSAFSLEWFTRQISCACAVTPRLHDLWFSIRKKVRFQFTWYQNEISYRNANISFGMKTGMNSCKPSVDYLNSPWRYVIISGHYIESSDYCPDNRNPFLQGPDWNNSLVTICIINWWVWFDFSSTNCLLIFME